MSLTNYAKKRRVVSELQHTDGQTWASVGGGRGGLNLYTPPPLNMAVLCTLTRHAFPFVFHLISTRNVRY